MRSSVGRERPPFSGAVSAASMSMTNDSPFEFVIIGEHAADVASSVQALPQCDVSPFEFVVTGEPDHKRRRPRV